jgi:hypothetical protein
VCESSFFSASSLALLLFVSLKLAILTTMGWNFSVVLIYISFTARDIEHFFIHALVIYSSSESYLFNSFAHLLVELFVILVLVIIWAFCMFCVLILYELNSWQIFSSILCVFSITVHKQKIFNLMQAHLSFSFPGQNGALLRK